MTKIILCGETGVGKTFLFSKVTNKGGPPDKHEQNKELNEMRIQVNETVVDLLDLSYKAQNYQMSQTHFKKTSGVILVYSVTARRTFDSLTKLLDDIRAVVDSSTCFMLIANNYS